MTIQSRELRGPSSRAVEIQTDDCPACHLGKLKLRKGERVPKSGAGGPRTLACDWCDFEMTSNLHGPDSHLPSP